MATIFLRGKHEIWRSPFDNDGKTNVPNLRKEDLTPIDAREVFFCNTDCELEAENIVRIFADNNDNLAVLVPYEIRREIFSYGTWYSIDSFNYKKVEIYQKHSHTYLVLEDLKNRWYVVEILCPNNYKLRPVMVFNILVQYASSKLEALYKAHIFVNESNKLYPCYSPRVDPAGTTYTHDSITTLKENEIFVFGSNLAGKHTGGAASFAVKNFGAIQGQKEGLQGQSYAIPTFQLSVSEIKKYVDNFIEFAKQNGQYRFFVSKIGCGIAGHKIEEIAPLFRFALGTENIILPYEFVNELTK